ncbi:MAG: hypothetical protein ACO1SV_03075 [Fimbriimonas sp.]
MKKGLYALSTFAIGAAILLGCGGGGSNPETSGKGLVYAPSAAPITLDNDTGVYNWIGLKEGRLETRVWGSVTDAGLPDVPIEISTGKSTAETTSRMFFTPDGNPSLVANRDLSATLSLTWLPDKLLARFYDHVGVFQGAANVVASGTNLVVTKETGAAPSLSGTYMVSLPGLDSGILSFTLQSGDAMARGCGQPGVPAAATRSVPTDLRQEWLGKLAGEALGGRLTPLQSQIVDRIRREHAAGGKSPLLREMVAAAMPGATQATYLEASSDWSAVFAALGQVIEQTRTLSGSWAALTPPERDRQFPMAADAFEGATYVASNDFPPLRENGDPTTISGIAFSREFETVTMKGTVDAEGQFKLQGSTADKGDFIVSGRVNGDGKVNGFWDWPFGDDEGELEGEREETQTCNASQESGGQGGQILTHNVFQACGEIEFSYEHYSIPDAVTVRQGDSILFSTGGLVSGSQSMRLKLAPNKGSLITVTVTAPRDGTAWDYYLGCPTVSKGGGLVRRTNAERP